MYYDVGQGEQVTGAGLPGDLAWGVNSRADWLKYCALGFLVLGCEKEPEDEAPGAVTLNFVSAMRRVHGDLESGKVAYNLLWEPARKNLQERARRASALSGRELHPGELIVPSWFALHLIPESYEQRVEGEWAQVIVHDAAGQSSTARLVREEGEWKVALELPALSPIRMREETGE